MGAKVVGSQRMEKNAEGYLHSSHLPPAKESEDVLRGVFDGASDEQHSIRLFLACAAGSGARVIS